MVAKIPSRRSGSKTNFKAFPSFKKWLLEQEREEDYRKYRFPGAFILSPAQSDINSVELPKDFDLRDYHARRGSRAVFYIAGQENSRQIFRTWVKGLS